MTLGAANQQYRASSWIERVEDAERSSLTLHTQFTHVFMS